jgi:hypothetical protein
LPPQVLGAWFSPQRKGINDIQWGQWLFNVLLWLIDWADWSFLCWLVKGFLLTCEDFQNQSGLANPFQAQEEWF